MQKRQAELTKLFKRLYEDSVLGRIPDEQYRILSQEYTAEQKEIQEQLPAMEVRLQELKDSSSNITRFIENAKRYSEIPELTAEILRIFIKRVEVGERAEKYSRTAPQEVRTVSYTHLSDQAAVCACAHSRYFAGGSPSGLRV